jgi:hypothetical protein
MNEIKVMVAQVLPQDVAEKVNKELVRREYKQRLEELIGEIVQAGFYIEVERSNYTPNNIFTSRITIFSKSLKG